jgi:multicomponent Na+:H+ antiporter subunit E
MTRVLLMIGLAFLWCCLWGSFSPYVFAAGVLVAWLVLMAFGRAVPPLHGGEGRRSSPWRVVQLVSFSIYFIRILIVANWQVAKEVMTPAHNQTPRILAYPVPGLTPVEVVVLSSAITLTPGTLVVDISDDSQTLYVHCLYAHDRAKAVAELDDLKHRLLKGVFGHA